MSYRNFGLVKRVRYMLKRFGSGKSVNRFKFNTSIKKRRGTPPSFNEEVRELYFLYFLFTFISLFSSSLHSSFVIIDTIVSLLTVTSSSHVLFLQNCWYVTATQQHNCSFTTPLPTTTVILDCTVIPLLTPLVFSFNSITQKSYKLGGYNHTLDCTKH